MITDNQGLGPWELKIGQYICHTNIIAGMGVPGVIYLVIALVDGLSKRSIVALLIVQQATNG